MSAGRQQGGGGSKTSPFYPNYSLFPAAAASAGSRRAVNQPRPYPYDLRPHLEEAETDAHDDVDVKTDSTVSLVGRPKPRKIVKNSC